MERSDYEREVDRNFDAFQESLSGLLPKRVGQFALMKAGRIERFYPTQTAALEAGKRIYADQPFSIQEVTDRPVDLGFFSHAIDTRLA